MEGQLAAARARGLYVYIVAGAYAILTDAGNPRFKGAPSIDEAGGVRAIALDSIDVDTLDVRRGDCLLAYDQCYGGGYDGVEGVASASVRNIENDRQLTDEFVTLGYAADDEAERELLVRTDEYYGWTSERAREGNAIFHAVAGAAQDVEDEGELTDRLRQLHLEFLADWLNVCAGYTVPDTVNELEIFDEMWDGAIECVSSNIRYIPDIEYNVR